MNQPMTQKGQILLEMCVVIGAGLTFANLIAGQANRPAMSLGA